MGVRRCWAGLITEYTALESGVERFVDLGKAFANKTALDDLAAKGFCRRFVTLGLEGHNARHSPTI